MSLLLQLPRELRDLIYAYVVAVDVPPESLTMEKIDRIPHYEVWNHKKFAEFLPSIYRTNKQLEQEVAPLFLRNTRLCISSMSQCILMTKWLLTVGRGFESTLCLQIHLSQRYQDFPDLATTYEIVWAFILRCSNLTDLVLVVDCYRCTPADKRAQLAFLRLENLIGVKSLRRLVLRVPVCGKLIMQVSFWLRDVFWQERGDVHVRLQTISGIDLKDFGSQSEEDV
ncbi:hypothetical protein K458DRAFT_384409 [Lentithecium fluviatile CBS 122367]|uniref:F-box domain-containing protein n=1 Tax=Lentithecium fluviatile CBS 122367 TaxID=1168545 RepID=A0A6G1JHQ4_9PLEO|nr:hypothetical protein K458DRAFT_384409 [Lentithecium fluviatile CBS 122367]